MQKNQTVSATNTLYTFPKVEQTRFYNFSVMQIILHKYFFYIEYMLGHIHVKPISEVLLQLFFFISPLRYLNLQHKGLTTRCQLSSTVTNVTVAGEALYVKLPLNKTTKRASFMSS